jgi:5-formyltetrahydrofolate cyclo-ligase
MGQQRKKEMRLEMKRVLANLDKRWQAAAHVEVGRGVIDVIEREQEFPITDVLAWVPSFAGEVDLAGVIGEMLKTRQVYLPRVVRAGSMDFIRVDSDWAMNLEKGAHGVHQPRDGYGDLLDGATIGRLAVLVPGIAFDARGARLGRGGGYYDRFLEGLQKIGALKIGVCWSMQIVPEVPTDPHDVHVDWLCHEDGVQKIDHKLEKVW